ncbi:MAG TPA: BON domain-containing protein [Dongiaceae bacterium]
MGIIRNRTNCNQLGPSMAVTSRCLITAILLLSSALGGAAVLSGCAVSSGQETAGQYVDDATITTKVKSALASDGGVTLANQVGVETGQGVVQLSGFVPSISDRARAENIARSVEGVRGVKNDLVVQ